MNSPQDSTNSPQDSPPNIDGAAEPAKRRPIWSRNPTATAAVGVALVAVVAWLAFGFFGIQSAFLDDEVNEAGPVFGADTAEDSGDEDASEAGDTASTDQVVDAEEVMDSDEFQEAVTEAEANRTESDDEMPMPGEVVTLLSGQFSGNSRYEINGDALVLNDGTEQRFLRFENFDSSNGPDLKVYLRAASGEFVSLGELKGNIGDQNYEIPTDVDLDEFSTVEIWCERFSVGFGQAALV